MVLTASALLKACYQGMIYLYFMSRPASNAGCMQASQGVDAEAESAIAISQYQANTDADEVDLALVEALLMYVCGEGVYKREGEDFNAAQGGVLIFLPGMAPPALCHA